MKIIAVGGCLPAFDPIGARVSCGADVTGLIFGAGSSGGAG